jgi:hypothetical protein
VTNITFISLGAAKLQNVTLILGKWHHKWLLPVMQLEYASF